MLEIFRMYKAFYVYYQNAVPAITTLLGEYYYPHFVALAMWMAMAYGKGEI